MTLQSSGNMSRRSLLETCKTFFTQRKPPFRVAMCARGDNQRRQEEGEFIEYVLCLGPATGRKQIACTKCLPCTEHFSEDMFDLCYPPFRPQTAGCKRAVSITNFTNKAMTAESTSVLQGFPPRA